MLDHRGAWPPLPGMGTDVDRRGSRSHSVRDLTDPDDDSHAPTHPSAAAAPVRTPRTLAVAGDLLRALAAPVRIAIVLQLLSPAGACTTWSTPSASPSR